MSTAPAGAAKVTADLRQPGDFCVCEVHGPVGKGIGFAEGLCGGGFTRWQHAKVYVGDGKILQAEPGGSQIIGQPLIAGELWSTGIIDLPAQVRLNAVSIRDHWTGIPYSELDYLALAQLHFKWIPNHSVWPERDKAGHLHLVSLRQFVASSGHMLCSQLVDAYLLACGWHLYTDGRQPGDVMPSDLGHLIETWKG